MEKNEPKKFDPNEPDRTDEGFFCRLCLSTMNSWSMWSSHIVGKRHIRNARKFPNGLPKRDETDDEDSYEKPPKRKRLKDPYDIYDVYPSPDYERNYYPEDYYSKRPPMDYEPIVKPDIVFDYGHSKEFEVQVPPPEITKTTIVPPSTAPVYDSVADVLPETFSSVLGPMLLKPDVEKHKPKVEDDFFKNLNDREIAKEIARELSKIGMPFFTSENKYDKSEPDVLDVIQSSKGKKEVQTEKKASPNVFDILQSLKGKKEVQAEKEASPDVFDLLQSLKRKKEVQAEKKAIPDVLDILQKLNKKEMLNEKKTFKLEKKASSDVLGILPGLNKKEKIKSEKKASSSSMTSSSKSKCELDYLDPDDLTPDILDSLLSARLKPKKSAEEVCTKKHCMKNRVNLDDPRILKRKLISLSTMEFLKIIHHKFVNLELTNPDELKMLLMVMAEAQAAVCKKLPPELQTLVKAKLSDGVKLPAQDKIVSQDKPAASNTSSYNSPSSVAPMLPSSQTTSAVNSVTSLISNTQFPSIVLHPISKFPVSISQSLFSQVTTVTLPQNQVSLSYSSSFIQNNPTITSMTKTPLTSTTLVNSPSSLQNFPKHNYYSTTYKNNYYSTIYQNYQVIQNTSKIQNLPSRSQFTALSRLSPPSSPRFVRSYTYAPISAESQLSKEFIKAKLDKLNNQAVKQQKQKLSSSSLKPTSVFSTLKTLETFEKEYKMCREKISQNVPNKK